jgi:membrane protein
VVVLLFGASGVFVELQTALNAIWMVQPKPDRGLWGILQDRFLSFTMVLGTCFLLLASLLVTTALAALASLWTPASLPGGTWLWQGLNALVSLAVITALFALLFKYLPDAFVAWQDVWLGAAVTAVLFLIGKHLLGLYLGWAAITSTYGAAGSVLAILLWVYYTAQIFLFGAAFTRVHAQEAGRRVQAAPNAMLVKQYKPEAQARGTGTSITV